MGGKKFDLRVLYVEDDFDTREAVSEMLQRWITELYQAENGRQGLELFKEHQIDLIISDLRMPLMDGLEMFKAIREMDGNIQIIVTSAYSDTDYFLKAIELGVTQYVLKPIDRQQFFSAIERCARQVEMERQLRLQEKELLKSKTDLELRVAERTADLLRANELLKLEIAEREQAEAIALDAYGQNLQLLSSIQSIVIGVSKEDLIFQWNHAAEKTFGVPTAAVIGKPFIECGISWNWDRVTHEINNTRNKGESIRLDEINYTRLDGKEGLLGFSINPIGERFEEEASYFLFGSDITDRKKNELKNALSQKLESIGQLAAGIAHEINTPIQYVGDNLHFIRESFRELEKLFENFDLLLDAVKNNSDVQAVLARVGNIIQTIDLPYLRAEIPKAIEQSQEGAARVTKIVRAMKDFSHPSQGEKHPADLNKALESAITISKNEWKYVADIETDFDPELPQVTCVIDEINQVILNLIVNAADAIKDSNPDGGKGKIAIKTGRKTGFVEIRISDTGFGIPPEIINKIFDPFFTTKEVGKGTGQGLTLAHDIVVNKHNGSIEAESELGKGTTFTIQLPVVAASKE